MGIHSLGQIFPKRLSGGKCLLSFVLLFNMLYKEDVNNPVKITKGFRYRIYPTDLQKQMMEQTFGNVRFVYNHFLNMRSEEWKNDHKSIGSFRFHGFAGILKRP